MTSGTPEGHPLATFTNDRTRSPPGVVMSPKRLPGSALAEAWQAERDGAVSSAPALQVPFDVAAEGHTFTPYHLGTNMPLYAPYAKAGLKPPVNSRCAVVKTPFHTALRVVLRRSFFEVYDTHAPVLAAAGIRVWRWPGGAASNFWCPSYDGEEWDACFE